ncbi:MAG: TetR/AcrR family transcriptional regulator [Gemmatimonadetes bacterium]|nr:TetR/AcrR family transcriptional regulator [Gemmatimonadota bacterium]
MTEALRTPDLTEAPDDGTPARSPRLPQQGRGQKRVEQILDAAEALIAEQGIEAITTNAIAEKAGSSMGSLYHFFPGGKEAVIEGLARRYQATMAQLNTRALDVSLVKVPLPELFRGIVMGMADFIAATPAFPAVHDMIMRVHCLPGGKFEEYEEAILEQIRRFLAARLPGLAGERREAVAKLSFQSVAAGVELSMRLAEPERTHILDEVQNLMVSYMGTLEREFGSD